MGVRRLQPSLADCFTLAVPCPALADASVQTLACSLAVSQWKEAGPARGEREADWKREAAIRVRAAISAPPRAEFNPRQASVV